MTIDEVSVLKCRFKETKECIETELFNKWKDDKKETAWLTLGICPQCSIYKEGLLSGETEG